MKPALFLGAAALFFAALLGAAFVWDSARALQSAYDLVQATDRELKNQEERVLNALPGIGAKGEELENVIRYYHEAKTSEERRRAFDAVIARVNGMNIAAADPTDPIRRRAADEFAGAQNRRQIALRHYEDAAAAYEQFSGGLRGSIGRKMTGLP